MQSAEQLKTELATALNEPVAITAFKKPTSAPFNIIIDDVDPIADDNGRVYAVSHDIMIERYTETGSENNEITEYLLERGIPFSLTQTYISEERLFMSVFSLEKEIIEKL